MDWTIFWTISWTMFWTIFWTILKGRSTPLVLREGWGGMKSISSEGGVGGSVLTQGGARGLILRREEWEVFVIINTTGSWSFYSIVQAILIGFSTEFLYV